MPDETQRVSMRTLDSVAGLTPPTMIKVDVEGYEAQVFRGAHAVLSSALLKAVITEGQRPADVALLLKAGFALYEYDPFQRMLSRAALDRSGNNALFLRDSSFAAARLRASSSFQGFEQHDLTVSEIPIVRPLVVLAIE